MQDQRRDRTGEDKAEGAEIVYQAMNGGEGFRSIHRGPMKTVVGDEGKTNARHGCTTSMHDIDARHRCIQAEIFIGSSVFVVCICLAALLP